VLLDLALQDVGDFGRLDVERHRSTFSRELRAELRELGAQAAVEDEVADAGDEAADQLRVDADFEIDRATDAARERLANAVELRGAERRRRQELAADAAGGLLGEPRELVADRREVARPALIDQERTEVREERREPERAGELRQRAAALARRMDRMDEDV